MTFRITMTIIVITVFGAVAFMRLDTGSTEAPVSAPTPSEPSMRGLQIN